jgi:hypothetical protein
MRRFVLLTLALALSVAGFVSAPPATAGSCVTYCSQPDACGYVCCYQQCCGKICVDLDCAPPPPCEGNN